MKACAQEIAHLHNAIRTAMESFLCEVQALREGNDFDAKQLAALVDRHRFLRSVCSYHHASEDDFIFPAARQALLRAVMQSSCNHCAFLVARQTLFWFWSTT